MNFLWLIGLSTILTVARMGLGVYYGLVRVAAPSEDGDLTVYLVVATSRSHGSYARICSERLRYDIMQDFYH